MTETNNLTPFQELVNRTGSRIPNGQLLEVVKRLERVEVMLTKKEPVNEAIVITSLPEEPKKKMGRPKGSKNKA